jgi:hypothetical protein
MDRTFLIIASLAVLFGSSILTAADSPLLAAPKAAPQPDQPDLLVSERKGGKFKGDGVYSSRLLAKQRLSVVATPRGITNYFRLQNDSRGLMTVPYSLFGVKGSKSDSRITISYFSDKGANVTARVTRGSYVLNIATDAEAAFRQKIVPNGPVINDTAYSVSAENLDTRSKDAAGVLLRHP